MTRLAVRTVSFFLASLFLVALHCILVSEKVQQRNDNDDDDLLLSSASLGFFSSSNYNNNNNYYLPAASALATNSAGENEVKTFQIVNCPTIKNSNNDLSNRSSKKISEFAVAVVTIGFAIVGVAGILIVVYLNSDVRSFAALDTAKRIASATLIIFILFIALMITIIAQTKTIADNDDASSTTNNNNNNINWPWPIMIVTLLLFSILFLAWSIRRVRMLKSVRIDFPEEDEEDHNDDDDDKQHQQRNEDDAAEREPILINTTGSGDIREKKQQHQQSPATTTKVSHNVQLEAATVTFYNTRNGIGRMLLCFVIVFALLSASLLNYSWFYSNNNNNNYYSASTTTTTSSIHSPIFGDCTLLTYVNTTSAQQIIFNSSSSSSSTCASFSYSVSTFISIYRGLNGTSLFFALLLAIGTVMQWTWCLVPLCFAGCALSCTVIGIAASEQQKCLSASNNNTNVVKLDWLFWIQVASAVMWFVTAIGGIIIQRCVSDGVEDAEE